MRSYTQAPSYQARLNERYFSPPNYLCIYTQLKKALLIVDRGSREPDVRHELKQICFLAKQRADYDHVDYSFLEVIPPFIPEGISQCMAAGTNFITVMPYFLYPGMKLKDTVKQSAKIGRDKNLKLVITKPLSYHPMMVQLIIDRIDELKKSRCISQPDRECDVVLIGHGSSDKNAHDAFVYAANAIKPYYRNVEFCFLELDRPNIENGIGQVVARDPESIIIVPYFLHKGAHIKRDVIKDVNAALDKYKFKNAFMGHHLGVDEKLVNIIIERAREVEKRFGL
ncbi:MAG: sirohydrochlorin chelatase [Thermoproteota archaeon]|nr:sirohydrochlorin chelatase [Thermoproteota archaeon]